ncbi:hypothetical protein BDR22DRAFT_842135 [Usnea florida]
MPDPFRRLPAPILLDIMKLLPSLPSLYQLKTASGAVSDMFEECSAEIVAAVIRPLPQEIQRVIRAVAIALSDKCLGQAPSSDAPVPNVSSALDEICIGSMSKDSIPRHLSFASIDILLNCACPIYQLAAQFLQCHIQRLNSIQPQHLADPKHRARVKYTLENYPKGRAYTPSRTDFPSWVEEYRVVRAFWLIQLYRIFQTELETNNGKESNVTNKGYGFPAALGDRLKEWELDNMECVQDWLNEMQISLYNFSEPVPLSSKSSLSLEEADTRSALDHPPTDKDTAETQSFNTSYYFFHSWGQKSPLSMLHNSQWQFFRRLGFGIWDTKRMVMMELLSAPPQMAEPDETVHRTGCGVRLDIGDISFTWKSIEDSEEQALSMG